MIAENRIAEIGQMDADLVRASGFELQFYQRMTMEAVEYLIVGDGCGTIRPDAAADGGAFIPANRRVNGACRGSGAAQADGSVLPIKTLGMQLTAQ